MLVHRAVLVLALCTGLLFAVGARAEEPAKTKSTEDDLRSTRIFKLQDMDSREAVTLLRTHVQVRQIAEIGDLNVVIVTDVAERVDLSESLLRKHEAVAATIAPHDPLRFDRKDDSPTETRVFRIEGLDTKAAVVVLRSIYGIRALTEREDNSSVTVTAPALKLDAIEALLRALGVSANETEPA